MVGLGERAFEVRNSKAEKDEGELYTAMREKRDPLGRVILRVMRSPLPHVVWVMGLILRLAHLWAYTTTLDSLMGEEGRRRFQFGWLTVPFSLVAGRIVPIHGSVITIKSVLGRKDMGLSSSFRIACVIGLLLLTLVQRIFIPIDGWLRSDVEGWWQGGERA